MIPVLTARLAIVVAVAAVFPLVLPSALTVVGVMSAVILFAALDWWFAPRPSSFGVERDLPRVVPLGATGTVVWAVRNPTERVQRVEIADELAPSLEATTRRASFVLPPHGRVRSSTSIQPGRRGLFRPSSISLRTYGPLRLAGRQETRQLPGELRVFPRFRSREEAELRITRGRILEIGLRSAQGVGGGTEFEQLREYAPDDEFRRIDWPATARSGKAIVRTFRAERNQTVLQLLDAGRVMAGRIEDVPRLEHAMDGVMTLTTVATRLGDRAGLVTFDREVRSIIPPSHTRGHLARVTEAMYALEPELVESDYAAAFSQTLARFRRRALLVIFSELAEQAMAETLLPALPLVLKHHVVIIASVADPQVTRWARSIPGETGTSYRKAAAIAALEERRRLAGRLRGLGATVVDETPQRFAAALADAYLEIKSRGRL